ncbi:DnaJ domain-containing protein [Legionella worsleiensis]|uniref:Chaperone protein DnaJ n=2 Tax=Legionella worsleiensis TaxID=45076 RepID=A0A0W1AK47_9GAMM|nr:DnaJ domain-containing protein [Legionella worsleiensis]KTD81654.1 chaperone protein DnaJ [Legionella worsleiensis]STY31936.1 chaperone protein DnaJ [Legionella worsleiensis]
MSSNALILRNLGHQKSRLRSSTHYEALQVSETTSFEVIRSAYRQQIKIFHNGVNDDNTVMHYQAVISAYRVLKDPHKRQAYDTRLARERAAQRTIFVSFLSTVKHAHEMLSSIPSIEELIKNYRNPLIPIYVRLGLSVIITIIGLGAEFFYPESMLAAYLCVANILVSCNAVYESVKYARKQNVTRQELTNAMIETINFQIEVDQRVASTIAYHRARTPKLTYKQHEPNTDAVCASTVGEQSFGMEPPSACARP